MGGFDEYFQENTIIHKVTICYSLQQNGKANCTIMGSI